MLLLAAVTPFLPVQTRAQERPPVAPAQFDPSDVYFQGYLATRAAESLEAKGDFIGATEKLEQAQKLIDGVLKFYPEWKPDMVKNRSKTNAETAAKIKPKADEQRKKNEGAVAELEGGAKVSGRLEGPAPMPLAPPGILEVDPLATRRLDEAQAEVRRLRQQLANAADNSESARNATRVGDLRKENADLAARLKAAETNVESLRARLTTSPAESEY
ncbi:MAG TPA: hypothetical protein VM511_09555, partial [Luteolibacter sp.]|nr:hypothetical protein [Luteolibacter sp.]